MKRFVTTICSAILLSILLPAVAFADPLGPGHGDPDPVTEPSGPGGDVPDGPGGEAPPPEEPKTPELLTYTPVVTVLHSVNAALAGNGTAVYFMPQLEDFPVDLADSCADVTTEDGKEHKFAVVYDGLFDTEVAYQLAQNDNGDGSDVSRLQTSKKVYSQTDNSRALNLLGYDLLLANEQCSLYTKGGTVNANYMPTLVGNAPLTTKTAVMDLYKAVGVYEWDVKVIYGIDEELDVNTSPLMQQIAVLTNDEVEGGIDTEEGATWVWATRTNPDIYWARCKRDAIFDGGAHLYTKPVYVGNNVSVSFAKNETQTLTMGEFCQLARAIMELYGEPVLTEMEIDRMIQAYALTLPASDMNAEQKEAVRYLAAKGIIDPSNVNWNKQVTFSDVEEILLRIADEDSRLTFKLSASPDNTMARAGYAKVPVADTNASFDNVEEIVNPYDSDYYDYFVEAVDNYTNFYLNKIGGIDLTEQDNIIDDTEQSTTQLTETGSQESGQIPVSSIVQEGKTYAFACDKLMVAGADSVATTPGSGYFEYLGLTEYAGRWYYHFKISRTLSSVTIQYDADPELETLLNNFSQYTLESADGGVYNYSEDLPTHMTFDEAAFSYEYIDATRVDEDVHGLADTESYLSQYTWMKVDYKVDKWNEKVKGTSAESAVLKYNQNGKNFVVTAKDLDEARQTGERRFEDPAGNVWWVHESMQGSATDYIIWICQTKMSAADFKKALVADSRIYSQKESQAYYRAEDGTLLASYEYLKRQGLCSNLQNLKAGSGIMLTTTGGNVALRSDLNLIIVGDTIIPADGELLFYKEGESYYINVKACLGWSDDYVIINNQSALIPLFRDNKAKSTVQKSTGTKVITTYFPMSTVNVAYSKLRAVGQSKGSGEGISLSGTNPLGCYMVVYDTNHDTDWLFVWHRNEVKGSDGGTHTVDEGDARSKFSGLTGVDLSSISKDYSLCCFQLNRNNSGNPAGIRYLYYDYLANYSAGTATSGYVYDPPEFNSVNSAFNTYITGSDSCALPIAKVDGKLINLNLNTCTDMEGNSQLPIGTLPMYMQSTSESSQNKMGAIQDNGRSVATTSATYDNLDSVKILAAPVGLFQVVKGLGTRSVAQWANNSGTLYFGSSKCKLVNGQVTVNGHALEFDDNVDAVCTLLSSGIRSIYVINEDSSSLGDLLEEKLEEIGVIVTDPETLIDWSAYKFSRLVQNMDDWTTILLIFVLNVLPRVGMLLFFALMLLSLIKDVKFWRSFCVNHFDVYSFLTMGKQNVDTVDMKRVVLISLICFSIFLIIMDGQLFNFIIFICKLFINITQR